MSPDSQLFPPWLGVFTFALSQVTSAVWMALDAQPCPRRDFHTERHSDDDAPGPIRHRNKKTDSAKLQFSPMKLEVHRSPAAAAASHGDPHVRAQSPAPDDPRLLSPGSERSSLESFEVIETPLTAEMHHLMAVYDRKSGVPRGESPLEVEDFSVVKHSSADLMDFDFSNLLSGSCGGQFTSSVMENYYFPPAAAAVAGSEGENCSLHMFVVGSDDGGSSFDILSEPGDDKVALLEEDFTLVDA